MFKLNDWRRGRKKAVDFVCFSDVDSKVHSGVKLSKTSGTLFCDITNECFPLFRQNHFRNYLELCALLAKENSLLEACVRSPLQKKLLYTVVEFQFSRGLFQIQLTAVHFLHRSKDRGPRSGNSLDFLKNSFGRSRIYLGQESQECVSRIQE